MLRPRELVECHAGLDGVAAGAEEGEVLHLCRGIAGDVDDLSGCGGDELGDGFGVNALARRIKEDDVGPLAGVGEALKFVEHVGGDELDVGKVVFEGGLSGFFDGFFDDFHADDALGVTGDDLRQGSGAAVEVVDGLAAHVTGQGDGFGVEILRAVHVGLKEREGSDVKGEVEERFVHFVATVPEVQFFRDDGIGIGIVRGVKNAHQGQIQRQRREPFAEFSPFVGRKGVGRRGDEVDHERAGGEGGAEDEVAQESGFSRAMVGRPAFAVAIGLDSVAQAIEVLRDDAAVRRRYNIVEMTWLMESQRQGAAGRLVAEGVFHFVAIVFRGGTATNLDVAQGGEFGIERTHLLCFEEQFGLVGQRLVIAAAADRRVGAGGIAFDGSAADEFLWFDDFGAAVGALDARAPNLAGESALHLHRGEGCPMVVIGLNFQHFADGVGGQRRENVTRRAIGVV